MQLPEITLTKVELTFDIIFLFHHDIFYFAIVLPVVIVLLDIMNVFLRLSSIIGLSFFLLLLNVLF